MKNIFLILLLIVLNCNLFGQAYYIEFDCSLDTDRDNDPDYSELLNKLPRLTWIWSDGKKDYSGYFTIRSKNGFYTNKIEKLDSYTLRMSSHDSIIICEDLDFISIDGFKECRISYSIEQHQILPTINLKLNENYYCVSSYSDIVEFSLPYLKEELCKNKYEFSFYQNNELKYSVILDHSVLRMSYSELCNLIDPLDSFYVIVNFETTEYHGFTVEKMFSPIYPYVDVDESKLEIVDDNFYYPELHGSQAISFKNIKTSLSNKINSNSTEPYNLEKYYGLYNVIIEEDKRCSLTKSFIYPELSYNYVNGTKDLKDKFHFWYEGESRESVDLSLYEVDTKLVNIELSQIKITPNMKRISKNEKFIRCQRMDNAELYDTVKVDEHIYSLSTTDALSKITITGNKDFIPVTKKIELKSYPKITDVKTEIEDAVCYYDTAIVKVSGTKGGLSNGYKFMLKKGEQEFWSENSTMKIPATIFGGNEQEVKLYVYDKDSISDDTGREKRAFSTNIKFKYGETLDIIDTNVVDLLCFEDNSGKILITDWTPKNDDIKFEVWNSENRVSESDITENLAAGDYNLKIIDGNKCVNDSFQVTLNQPEFPLEISKDTVKNPVCFGYSNGRIITHTTGGTQPYTYSWNNGSQDTAIYNLKAGTYILSVTDSHGCKDTATQELVDPEELQNSLTPSHTICKNGELKIDEGDLKSEDLHYSWLLPNGTVHNERVLVVKSDMPEGNYVMISQDTSGCFTADTTNIKFSDNELNIKFLAPTYSYLGDTVVLAEDSEVYKNFSWSYVFNEDMFTDITSSMSGAPYNHTFLESFKYGSDTITMYANDGRCNASYSKVVNILNEQRADYSDYNAPSAGIFTRLAIGPSYNDGNFTLFANLTEESELKMFILDLQRGIKIPLKYNSNYVSDHYAIPFHGLNLSEGVYALFVTANGDTKYVKFTVK